MSVVLEALAETIEKLRFDVYFYKSEYERLKKELEETIKMIDNIYEQLNSEEQRKRA